MSKTMWNREHENWVNQRMSEDVTYARTIVGVLKKMREGFYNPQWLEAILQKWRGDFNLYEADAFIQVHASLLTGRMLHTVIEIGSTPSPDQLIKDNNEKLSVLERTNWTLVDDLNECSEDERLTMRAEFWGGTQDEDGFFEWRGPLWLHAHVRPFGARKIQAFHNGKLPLEVGYLTPGQLLSRLGMQRGLVRWPYSQSKLWVLKVVDPALWGGRLLSWDKSNTEEIAQAEEISSPQQLELW